MPPDVARVRLRLPRESYTDCQRRSVLACGRSAWPVHLVAAVRRTGHGAVLSRSLGFVAETVAALLLDGRT